MAFQAFAVTWKLFVLALVLFDVAQADIPEAEFLVAFLNQLTDTQESLYDWGDSSQDPCGTSHSEVWTGVTCVNISGSSNANPSLKTVTELDLSSFGISGSISAISKLVGLKNLKQLLLRDNSFSGQIPHEITELRSLEALDLGNNQIDGTIPELPSSVSLLSLRNNLLAGDIVQMNVFNLSLEGLDLHGNGFTGTLPSTLKDTPLASFVSYLDLSHNQIRGFLPSDLAYVRLEYCDMSNNQFEGSIPEGPWDPEWSYYIDFSANKLTGRIPQDPQSFKNLISTSYVNLSHNTLSGTVDLSSAGSFHYLDLSFNQLEGDVAISNGTAQGLQILRLQNNRFSGNLNGILGGGIEFPKLRELALGDNKFGVGELNSILPAQLAGAKFPLLQILSLSGSGVTGKFPSELFQNRTFPNMQILDLSNNLLTGTINVSLLQMPLLRELRLRNNSLNGTIDVGLSAVDDLRVLDLSHNFFQFNDSEMQAMFDVFSNLRELRLSTRGPRLPTSVGHLPSLEILDLRNCGLIGGIPDQYSLLRSLKFLDLSDNRLVGPLPEGFGSMPELTELNVSNNSLTGEIPRFHFHNFSKTVFAGNDLCGSPLAECKRPSRSSGLKMWEIVMIVVATVTVSGGSCLFFGWIWRRKVEAKKHKQDEELIATLLDRDTTTALMSLRELRRATDEFSEENQVGVGGFGTVYWGTLDDGTEVAIKKSKRDASSSEEKRMFLNEVKILSQVHHRHLVRLLGCCLTHKDALLVFEFVKNGTLDEHLRGCRGSKPLSWEKRIHIALQTADALNYLHSSANPPIYHLDVKSANILLDENMHAKVADFGISKLLPAVDVTHITAIQGIPGTLGYVDPEAIVSSLWTAKSDVYAYGVVLLELITAKSAVDRSRGEDASLVTWAVPLIQSGRLEEIIDPTILETFRTPNGRGSMLELARIADRCLRFESVLRPSTKEALKDLLDIQQRYITGT